MKLGKRSRWMILFVNLLTALGIFLVRVGPVQGDLPEMDMHAVEVMVRVWNEVMPTTPAGQYYQSLAGQHTEEAFQLMMAHPERFEEFWRVADMFIPGLEALVNGKDHPVRITTEQVERLNAQLNWYASLGSQALREDIQREQQRLPLDHFVGMTVSEAWEFINSHWTPDMVVQPTPTPEITPPTPELVIDQVLVPESNGRWAYYVHDGVYLEYPANYHIQLLQGSIFFTQAVDLSEGWGPSSIIVDIWQLPLANKEMFTPTYLYAPKEVLWERNIRGEVFEGAEYISRLKDDSVLILGTMLYNQKNQIGVHIHVNGIPLQEEDFALLGQRYENFKHMVDHIRIQIP